MKKNIPEFMQIPLLTTAAGILMYAVRWLTVFRMTQKTPWSDEMNIRLISNRFSISLVMIIVIGVFFVRLRCKTRQTLIGCGILVLWGLAVFGAGAVMHNAQMLLKILETPVYMFGFLSEYLGLFGVKGPAFLMALPSILAPCLLALFLLGREEK